MRFSAELLLICLALGCSEDQERRVKRPDVGDPGGPSQVSAPPSDAAPTLAWTGCDISKKAYMTLAARRYEEATGVRIVVTGGGATRGIRATVGGGSDIGGSCRHCLPGDSTEEVGAIMTHVGWDALVFCTHKSNRVEGLTEEQAKGILDGSIINWMCVGGIDARILPVFRLQTKDGRFSGVGYMTRLLLFKDRFHSYTDKALFKRSSRPIEEFVEQTESAFAVTGVSSAKKRNVNILKFEGVEPTPENIASGTYRLFRPLYLVTKGEPTGETKRFLDWIVGPDGQAVLKEEGTVTLKQGVALKDLFKHWPEDRKSIRNFD